MKKLVLVGQTPPPYHGQAIATQFLFDHDWDGIKVERIRLEYSSETDKVGKFQVGKLFHLLVITAKTISAGIRNRGAILYYPPGGPWTVPVIRDIIYLICVRPFFRAVVFHFHAGGLPDFLESKGVIGVLARFAYRKPDVAISLYPQERTEGEYFRAKHQCIIPNGMDVPFLTRCEGGDDSLVLLYVGLLEREKGVMEILETVVGLKNQGVAVEARIVGGWYEEGIKTEALEYVDKHDINSEVTFLGIRKGDEKWAEYANADIFFFPSYYSNENFPLVLIEALAYGLPVVTTDWRGIPALVGDAGVVLPIKDVPSYVNAIQLLAKDGDQLDEYSMLAVKLFHEKYSLDCFLGAMREAVELA